MKKTLLFCLLFSIPSSLAFSQGVDAKIHIGGGAEFLGRLLQSVTGIELFAGTKVSIQNQTVFFDSLYFFDGTGTNLVPGEEIYDGWTFEFERSVTPVVVLHYQDPAHRILVGMDMRSLEVGKDKTSSYDINRIYRLDGSFNGWQWLSPYPAAGMVSSRKFRIPHIENSNQVIIEVLNCTLSSSHISLNGPEVAVRESGGIYVGANNPAKYFTPQSLSLGLSLTHPIYGFPVGFKNTEAIQVAQNGPTVIMRMITPQGILPPSHW